MTLKGGAKLYPCKNDALTDYIKVLTALRAKNIDTTGVEMMYGGTGQHYIAVWDEMLNEEVFDIMESIPND